MEVATKVRLGKLPEAEKLVTSTAWLAALRRLRAEELAITTAHSLAAGSLDWPHRDPFDRLLAAQAILEQVPLVSIDPVFSTLPQLTVVWEQI